MPTVIADVLPTLRIVLAPVVLAETNGVAPEVSAARDTYKRLAYARKLAAENHVSALKLVGLANLETRVFSVSTRTLSPIGPQRKTPAMAPSDVATDGTTVVRSISDTFTPGDS
jgi:hypothetical protein